jgi:hypothetical protein
LTNTIVWMHGILYDRVSPPARSVCRYALELGGADYADVRINPGVCRTVDLMTYSAAAW